MRLAILLAFCAVAAHAQLDNDTITVTAMTLPSGRSDDVQVSLTVSADLGIGLGDIQKAFPALGISERDLISAYQQHGWGSCPDGVDPCPPPPDYVEWSFQYARPFAKLQETAAVLKAARAASNPGIRVEYQVWGGRAGSSQCAVAALVAEARRHAEAVAAAAGFRIGVVVAISDGYLAPQTPSETVPSQADGGVGAPGSAMIGQTLTSPSAAAGCTAVVQFKLLR